MGADKVRLDLLLVDRGHQASREQARRVIMAGLVYVDGKRVDKPGTRVDAGALLEVRGTSLAYVSRGGLKLEHALEVFQVQVEGKVALDAGASTGGFTDCLLQRGARRVYAVDVGYGQLDWTLRNDPRVVVMERRNVRHLTPDDVDAPVDLVTVDVAFISLRKVLGPLRAVVQPGGRVLALVKPQFEAGADRVGKHGVVKDPAVHEEVLTSVSAWALRNGYDFHGATHSPIKGPRGNIEYFLALDCAGGRPSTDHPPTDGLSANHPAINYSAGDLPATTASILTATVRAAHAALQP